MKLSGTGRRPDKLYGFSNSVQVTKKYDDLMCCMKRVLEYLYEYHDLTDVFSGGALGTDILLFMSVSRLKNEGKVIGNHLVLPFKGYESRWKDSQIALLQRCIQVADSVSYGEKADYKERNTRLISSGDMTLSVWEGQPKGGTYDAVQKSIAMEKKMIQINPSTLKTDWRIPKKQISYRDYKTSIVIAKDSVEFMKCVRLANLNPLECVPVDNERRLAVLGYLRDVCNVVSYKDYADIEIL